MTAPVPMHPGPLRMKSARNSANRPSAWCGDRPTRARPSLPAPSGGPSPPTTWNTSWSSLPARVTSCRSSSAVPSKSPWPGQSPRLWRAASISLSRRERGRGSPWRTWCPRPATRCVMASGWSCPPTPSASRSSSGARTCQSCSVCWSTGRPTATAPVRGTPVSCGRPSSKAVETTSASCAGPRTSARRP